MTPSERRALVFLAAVAALGVGARGVRSGHGDPPSAPETRAALARQIAAVDSARATGKVPRGKKTRAPRGASRSRAAGGSAPNEPAPPVDLDVADSAALERLPRIGPALARRIVADRDSQGAFGSLAGLERVRGIGPGLSKVLAPHVTFSGTPRPTSAAPGVADRRSRADGSRRPNRGSRRRSSVRPAPSPRARPIAGEGATGLVSP